MGVDEFLSLLIKRNAKAVTLSRFVSDEYIAQSIPRGALFPIRVVCDVIRVSVILFLSLILVSLFLIHTSHLPCHHLQYHILCRCQPSKTKPPKTIIL